VGGGGGVGFEVKSHPWERYGHFLEPYRKIIKIIPGLENNTKGTTLETRLLVY